MVRHRARSRHCCHCSRSLGAIIVLGSGPIIRFSGTS
uniref:Uncharacterized protein n=1 Tax=Arundo donax TaxID=35708 RepID=A0A0A9BG49_ARUDO